MDNIKTLTINEGTINFWIKPNQVSYNDGQAKPLVQVNPQGGSILIVKDSDNFLKFFHVNIGKGRTDVIYDISNLDTSKPHMFTATWSLFSREIKLYVDGAIVANNKINYS